MASNCYPYSGYLMRKRGIVAVLKSAACEWVVILVMLFNGVVSYLINKFASYNDVQIPCVFCSRIDHAVGNKKPGFNSKLLCQKHMVEISSMVLCVIHDKVANGGGMCEECLLSNTNKHDSTIYRALSRKGGSPHCKSFLRDTDFASSSVGTRLCSCCKKPWIMRNKDDKTPRFTLAKPNIPLPNCNNMKHHHLLRGSLTDVEYSGLRFTSDSESELPFSDEEDNERDLIKQPKKDLEEEIRVLRLELGEERERLREMDGELEEERKRTSALLGELEEERNASAVAANETMAMITRLQEEKALLHMEALQYLRMMEEQAEYNVDALEKANDLLAEREKEIMEMEADIEAYHSKLSSQRLDVVEEEFRGEKTIITDALKEMETKVKKLGDDLSCKREGGDGGESLDLRDLREKVRGFESDWNFMKHTVKSLDYGEEGLRFVEEIARSLAEIRKIGY